MNGYEFTIVQDFYIEDVDKDGNPEVVLVKPNLKTKWYCRDLNMISSFEQVYNTKGNIRMHHTGILVNGEERIVRLPYNKVKELLYATKQTTAGFKQ
tara:strand:- start:232 stop:522 length:291 start_codon:yes stop_codon:yes gene_type:complete